MRSEKNKTKPPRAFTVGTFFSSAPTLPPILWEWAHSALTAQCLGDRRKQKLALLEQLLAKGDNQAPESTSAGQAASPRREDTQTVPGASSSAGFNGLLAELSASPGPSTYSDVSFDSPWLVSSTNGPVWSLATGQGVAASSAAVSNLAPHSSTLNPSFLFGHTAGKLVDSGNRAGGGPSQPQDPSSPGSLSQLSPYFSPQGAQPPSASQYTSRKAKEVATRDSSQRQRDESLDFFLKKLMELRVPDVKKVIYVQQNGLFAAIMDNTLAIGIMDRQLLFKDDTVSPFNKEWVESKGSIQLSEVKSKFSATPKDLQPVDIQITDKHHMYLDTIPFPLFRETALKALACDPPLFDEDELCYDICNREGLVVWGSQGNDQGMDACRPWDMRSWEPKPWFLRKYHFLAGGWEDEMWKAARWWHTMRSERISGPESSTAVV